MDRLSLHVYWQQRQRAALARAITHYPRQLQVMGLLRWRVHMPLRRLRLKFHRQNLRRLWQCWRWRWWKTRRLRLASEAMAVRCVSTWLALGVKFRRRAILEDAAARREHERRTRAALLLQRRTRGLLLRLSIARDEVVLGATFTLASAGLFAFTDQQGGQTVRAALLSGRYHDMRAGLMLRFVPQASLAGEGGGGDNCVFHVSVAQLMAFLRYHAPKPLRVPLELKQVGHRHRWRHQAGRPQLPRHRTLAL